MRHDFSLTFLPLACKPYFIFQGSKRRNRDDGDTKRA